MLVSCSNLAVPLTPPTNIHRMRDDDAPIEDTVSLLPELKILPRWESRGWRPTEAQLVVVRCQLISADVDVLILTKVV